VEAIGITSGWGGPDAAISVQGEGKKSFKKGGGIMKKSLLIKQEPPHLLCTLYGLASSGFAAAGASLTRHDKNPSA
jgi:hypothetical protein